MGRSGRYYDDTKLLEHVVNKALPFAEVDEQRMRFVACPATPTIKSLSASTTIIIILEATSLFPG
jgi:hypothetical protein